MKPSEVIWFNGEIVPWEAARVHVLAHALHYGSSVFEGIRTYATPPGPAVFCLDDHLRRLYDSCRITRMTPPYAPELLRDAILTLVVRNGHQSCYIRPVVFRGMGSLNVDPRKSPIEVEFFSGGDDGESVRGDLVQRRDRAVGGGPRARAGACAPLWE